MGDLTKRGAFDLLHLLQPKSARLRAGRCGRPKFLKQLRPGRTKQPVSRPLSRPSPTA